LDEEVDRRNFDFSDFASSDEGRSWLRIGSLPGVNGFEVRLDTSGNLLTVAYRGRVTPAQVETCAAEVEAALLEVKPGFRLLVDLSRLEWMDPRCAAPIRRIMSLCNKAGVSAVARVIASARSDIGLGIMSSFHYGPQVRILTCPRLEEAIGILSE
jgi:hypothetical protein